MSHRELHLGRREAGGGRRPGWLDWCRPSPAVGGTFLSADQVEEVQPEEERLALERLASLLPQS